MFLRPLYSEKVPVYEGEIDRVVGVAIAKDALRFAMQPQLHDTMKVSELMEPTYFVPESMRVQVVLEEMRRRRLHMAIVVSHELWGLKKERDERERTRERGREIQCVLTKNMYMYYLCIDPFC